MSYSVYKVTGHNTSKTYYGFVHGDGTAAQATFLVGANRKTGERGDKDMLKANNDDQGSLTFAIVDTVDTEDAAFSLRNQYRSTDPFTITGPTNWPANVSKRVAAADPEAAKRWSLNVKQRKAKTARDAYALGAWTFEQIKMANMSRGDLDTLDPIEFAAKYNLAFGFQDQLVAA